MKVLKYGSFPRSGTHWFGHLLWWAFYRGTRGLGAPMRPSHGHRFRGHEGKPYCEWYKLFAGHYSTGIDIYVMRDEESSKKSAKRLGLGWIGDRSKAEREEGQKSAKFVAHYEDLKADPNGVMLKIAKVFGLGSPAYIPPEVAAIRVGYDPYDPAIYYTDLEEQPTWLRDYHLEKLAIFQWLPVPKRVVELGVRVGYGARLIHEAWPNALYFGYDGELDRPEIHEVGRRAVKEIDGDYRKHDLMKIDDLKLQADFVHVDACHTVEGARHDVELALKTGAKWIMIDDMDDERVYAGVVKHQIPFLRVPLPGTPKEVALIKR